MDQNAARAILQQAFPNSTKEIEEYIVEAETQEGSRYWSEIVRSPDHLINDMKLYLEALEIDARSAEDEDG